MESNQERERNHTAFRKLKPTIDQAYPRGQYVAIGEGMIVADAESFEELSTELEAIGRNVKETLVVQAGIEYPETGIILLGSPSYRHIDV